MEENRSFSVIGHLPKIQSAISIGEDSVRIKMDIPLHNQDQKDKIMYLQSLMQCVFKLTFTIEAVSQKDYFFPKLNAPKPEPEPVEDPTYQSPDELQQLKTMRSKIHLELVNAGLELELPKIYQAIVGQKRLHHCTIDETKEIWNRITDGKPEPDPNRTKLRDRMLQLIGGA
ncbi:hypothetical protein LLG10_06335 [bacterium]|nr:hypothetical protein [bacterium]